MLQPRFLKEICVLVAKISRHGVSLSNMILIFTLGNWFKIEIHILASQHGNVKNPQPGRDLYVPDEDSESGMFLHVPKAVCLAGEAAKRALV